MDSDSETEECKVIARTYDKMKSRVHKIGFVEGLTSGKEAAFQKGFDEGYKEGFSSGFQLGKLNGVLSVLQESSRDDVTAGEVIRNIKMEQNTRRGMCLLCNPLYMDSYLQSSCSDVESKSDSLETNIKCQQETVRNAVCAHLTKVKNAYEFFNIPVPPNVLDSQLINKT